MNLFKFLKKNKKINKCFRVDKNCIKNNNGICELKN